jgi:hypothetical protein
VKIHSDQLIFVSNAFAPNPSCLARDVPPTRSVKTCWLPVDLCRGGSLLGDRLIQAATFFLCDFAYFVVSVLIVTLRSRLRSGHPTMTERLVEKGISGVYLFLPYASWAVLSSTAFRRGSR